MNRFQVCVYACDPAHENSLDYKKTEVNEWLPPQGHLHACQSHDALVKVEHLGYAGEAGIHILQTYHSCSQKIPCLFQPLIALLHTKRRRR